MSWYVVTSDLKSLLGGVGKRRRFAGKAKCRRHGKKW